MDKCVFYAQKSKNINSEVVRLSKNTMEIIGEIRDATGLPASKIVEDIVEFCADKIEIKEV